MNMSTAVMARRAAADIEADSELQALYRKLDFFPTPPWATRAGAELIRRQDPAAEVVWECACGEGHMAVPLGEYFDVIASDVHPHGFGDVIDFLAPDADMACDWIVTNPPFRVAGDFLRHGLVRARRGVALLLRLPFLEGAERYHLLHGEQPLTFCAPFSERVPMALGRWDPELSSATAYAWFVWDKQGQPMPIQPIGPGTRARLSRQDDAARFAMKAAMPLFDLSAVEDVA